MKNIRTLVSVLLTVLSIAVVVLALRWMLLDQPWLLDQEANEANLGLDTTAGTLSFDEWFTQMANPQGTQKYLYSIYRFFGVWMAGMGLSWLAILYFGRNNRRLLHVTLGIMGLILVLVYFFEYRYIWTSFYVPLSFVLGFIWLVALGLHIWDMGRSTDATSTTPS